MFFNKPYKKKSLASTKVVKFLKNLGNSLKITIYLVIKCEKNKKVFGVKNPYK